MTRWKCQNRQQFDKEKRRPISGRRCPAMSRRTFTRHFQKATGMTVVEWLVNERLRRGRELLETTSLSVEAISERVGFHTATASSER